MVKAIIKECENRERLYMVLTNVLSKADISEEDIVGICGIFLAGRDALRDKDLDRITSLYKGSFLEFKRK